MWKLPMQTDGEEVSGFRVQVASCRLQGCQVRAMAHLSRFTSHHSLFTIHSFTIARSLFQPLYFNHFNAGVAYINNIKFVAVNNDPFFDFRYHFVVVDNIP